MASNKGAGSWVRRAAVPAWVAGCVGIAAGIVTIFARYSTASHVRTLRARVMLDTDHMALVAAARAPQLPPHQRAAAARTYMSVTLARIAAVAHNPAAHASTANAAAVIAAAFAAAVIGVVAATLRPPPPASLCSDTTASSPHVRRPPHTTAVIILTLIVAAVIAAVAELVPAAWRAHHVYTRNAIEARWAWRTLMEMLAADTR